MERGRRVAVVVVSVVVLCGVLLGVLWLLFAPGYVIPEYTRTDAPCVREGGYCLRPNQTCETGVREFGYCPNGALCCVANNSTT